MEVTYDLARSPVTFDFVNFLINAERARLERGETEINLNIALGERAASLRDFAFSWERKQWRVQSLLAQLPYLLPSVSSVTIGGSGQQEFSYEQGKDFQPILKAPEGAMAAVSEYIRFGKPYVTITLRDSDFQPERNSNLAEWVKIADWFGENGYEVVFVPDTEAVIDGRLPAVGDHHTYIPAAMSQPIRLALYEYATLNCFTSGGPVILGLWSSAPTYTCRMIHEKIKSCAPESLVDVGLHEASYPEKFKWVSWSPDDAESVIPQLKDILITCSARMRPMILPKTFSAVSEDDRKQHAISALARGYKCFEPALPHDRTMILVCYGPSLKHTGWEIPRLEGDIFTVSGAHDYVVNMGITPYAHIESDPRPHKAKLITQPNPDTKYYLASCCHPDVFDVVSGCPVELWHPWNSDQSDAIINEIDPTGFIVLGGSNVGLRAIALGTGLGYRKFVIFGMDCSFDLGGAQHAGTHSGKRQRTIKVYLPDKRWYWTSPSMIQGCADFFDMLPALRGCEIDLKGDGLLQHRLRLSQQHQEAA